MEKSDSQPVAHSQVKKAINMPNLKVKVEKNKDQEMDLSASSYSQMDSHNSAMTPV